MKSMRKLTIKNLLLNKTRTLVTMVGILLSAALITLAACMALSIQQTAVNLVAQRSGNYTASLYGKLTNTDFEKYQKDSGVQNAFGVSYIGVAKNEYPKYESVPYISIIGISDGAFEECFNTTLSEGRYPQNSNEVVLSKKFVKSTKKEYHAGDKITLGLGQVSYFYEYTGETVIAPNNAPFTFEEAKFDLKSEKTYTIVGITDNVSDGIDNSSYYSGTVYIYTVTDNSTPLDRIYLQFTPSAEQNYIQTLAHILDSEEQAGLFYGYTHGSTVDMSSVLEKNHLEYFGFNTGILSAKLIDVSLEEGFMVAVSLVIIFGIIIISSIFIIRNSFYISISEKAKLYGMLSSIGATPRQIRNNVFFEGFIIGLFSIPVGIVIGIFGTAGLVNLCNSALADTLGGVKIQFAVSWLSILITLVLCAGTIFMSVLSPAIETSRIAPIEAIRGNREVKISKRKRKKAKSYKTPKIISKWFGVGGSIAWKNLKRSKAKYRATVISITVSVAIYLAISTVIGSLVSYVENSYQTMSYNMTVGVENNFTDKNSAVKSFDEFHQLADRDEIDLAVMQLYYVQNFILPDFPKEKYSNTEDNDTQFISLSVLDNDTYNEFAKAIGYESQKGKYILLDRLKNYEAVYDENGNYAGSKEIYLSRFKDMEGYTFKLMDFNAYEYEERKKQSDFEEEWGYIYTDGYMEKYGNPIEITVGAVIDTENGDFMKQYSTLANIDVSSQIIVNEDWLFENFDKTHQDYWSNNYFLYSSDDMKTEEALDGMGIKPENIRNMAKEVAAINAVSFIMQFFVYGFIGILALIGLTNVFNTINTNMNLRKKEFAALRSVGMTTREFDSMITLESIFYTFKALIIGVPIGLVLGWLGYDRFHRITNGEVVYTFPLIPLLLSVGVVALLVWLIMTVSIRKVRNRNIIETIRSDNI